MLVLADIGLVERSQIRLTTLGAHTLTATAQLSSAVGCDVRSRLASCLKMDGFEGSHYLHAPLKNARGSKVSEEFSGERIWEKAARAAQ